MAKKSKSGPLTNHKHELFARYLFEGFKQSDAYEKAGYVRHDGSASALRRNPNIERRLTELEEEAAKAAGLSKSFVISGLIDIYREQKQENPSAAVKSLELLGKTEGLELFTDKSKNKNEPATIEEVLALFDRLPQDEKDKLLKAERDKKLKVVNQD